MQSADLLAKIAVWREKARQGTLTADEQREAIAALRQDRKSAAVASETSRRKKAVAVVPDAKALLADLGKL